MSEQPSDVQSVIIRLQKANRIMEKLIDISMEDQKMTQDEKDILFSINNNMQKYAEEIMNSIQDGNITTKEFERLGEVEQKIIEDARTMAERDSNITENERKMLSELITSIREISSI